MAVGTAGDILVVVEEDRAGFGSLFRVNPMNGSRSRLSDFANATQGPAAGMPHGVVLGPAVTSSSRRRTAARATGARSSA